LIERAVVIEVAGEVEHPGIYRFEKPVSVERIISEAGARGCVFEDSGKKPDLTSGSLLMFRRGGAGCIDIAIRRMDAAALIAHRLPIDLNKANGETLELLPGIGPVLAGRIVAWREGRGEFKKEEDLLQVRGIGPRTLGRIRSQLTIADQAPEE